MIAADGPGPRIGLIWAQSRAGVIGADGALPWHLPEDLQHFRRSTQGAPVIMGRRTWESFPPRFRPLPGRTNIVITRREELREEGAVVVGSLQEALEAAHRAQPEGRSWVIGGGGIFREAIELADLLLVTEIDLDVDGDTLAPEVPGTFHLEATDPEEGWHEGASGLRYRIRRYER